MDPTKRRKSTLGQRYLNGEKREKVCLRTVLPTVTPRARLGRSKVVTLPTQASSQLKASKDFIVRKQLFGKSPHFSSGKKYLPVPTTRFQYTSPNESQGSYQSDSSLNVTGVQSIPKVPSPVSQSLSTNAHLLSSCLDYRPSTSTVSAVTTLSSSLQTTSSAAGRFSLYEKLERPKSPPPSRYELLMKLERAKIKAPVDLAEVTLMKDLSLYDRPDFYKSYLGSSNSTLARETCPKNFSPALSSTCVKSAFPIDLESKNKLNVDLPSAVRLQETTSRPNVFSQELDSTFRTDLSDISGIATHGTCNDIFQRDLNADKTKLLSFETRLKSFEEDKNETIVQKDLDTTLKSSDHKHNLSFESRLKFLDLSKSRTLNLNSKCSTEQQQCSSGTNPFLVERESTVFVKSFPNVKISPCNNLFSTVKHNAHSTNLPLEARCTEEKVMLNTTSGLDVTLTSQEDTTNTLGSVKRSAVEKQLGIINESSEKDSHEGIDMNSTDSFEKQEKTIVIRDQTVEKSQTGKMLNSSTNGIEPSLEVDNFSDSDDESVQIFNKLDGALKKMDRLKSGMNKMKIEMNRMQSEMESSMDVVKSEILSLKPSLLRLMEKRRRQKSKTNKENIPTNDTKQVVKSKWFNDLKLENPNLLKTPNPARRSVSRMSFVNQSIMTPHSLSVVLNDQLDELFED